MSLPISFEGNSDMRTEVARRKIAPLVAHSEAYRFRFLEGVPHFCRIGELELEDSKLKRFSADQALGLNHRASDGVVSFLLRPAHPPKPQHITASEESKPPAC